MNIKGFGSFFGDLGGINLTGKLNEKPRKVPNYAKTLNNALNSSGQANKTSVTNKTTSVSTDKMTMNEYKQYIYNKISEIPVHPTRANDNISVDISEAGFKAMKNDPKYEQWVLNDMKTGWSQPDVWSSTMGPAYHTVHYGATKEECRAEGWYAGYRNGNGKNLYELKSKNSFWQRRSQNNTNYIAQSNKKTVEQLQLQQKRIQYGLIQKSMMSSGSLGFGEKIAVPSNIQSFSVSDFLLGMGNVSGNGKRYIFR